MEFFHFGMSDARDTEFGEPFEWGDGRIDDSGPGLERCLWGHEL
jgi:hypothetical protein